MNVAVNDWVLVSSSAASYAVVLISEIALLWSMPSDQPVVRMWCSATMPVDQTNQNGAQIIIMKSSARMQNSMLVRVEMCSLALLQCEDRGDRFEFRYTF